MLSSWGLVTFLIFFSGVSHPKYYFRHINENQASLIYLFFGKKSTSICVEVRIYTFLIGQSDIKHQFKILQKIIEKQGTTSDRT